MTVDEALVVMRERRDYLVERIVAKTKRGWDIEWDTREHEALSTAIDALTPPGGG